jgi:hypothetical protein
LYENTQILPSFHQGFSKNKPTKTNFRAPYPFLFFINYFSLEVSGLPGCYCVWPIGASPHFQVLSAKIFAQALVAFQL